MAYLEYAIQFDFFFITLFQVSEITVHCKKKKKIMHPNYRI